MKMIDTHAHLNFKAYDADREAVIKRTLDRGIFCINVGTKYETSKKAVELAEQYDGLYAAIGLHPIHIKNDFFKARMDEDEGGFTPAGEDFDESKYQELAKSKKVVAVGEVGLDYYYKPKTTARLAEFKALQKSVFLQQLNFARKANLPLIIHCRMAHGDILDTLKEEQFTRGVVHCFTGTVDEMKEYVALGFYVGFNGIMFKLNLDDVIRECPVDRMVMETDCPYLTAPQAPDKRNEPLFITYALEKIAQLKGMSLTELEERMTENAKKLFNIA